MPLVSYVVTRPYTVVAALIVVGLLGIGEALRMPVDSFPKIDIAVSVVWTYAGMSAEGVQNRILTLHETTLASLVDDISRIEARSHVGVAAAIGEVTTAAGRGSTFRFKLPLGGNDTVHAS